MPKGIKNIQFSFTKNNLTHYGGLFLIYKFCKKLNLRWYFQNYVKFHQRNQDYQTAEFILILIYMIIAGIGRIENARHLGYNGVIKKILGIKSFPEPTVIRRFLYRLTPQAIRQIVKVHNLIQWKIFRIGHVKTSITIDIDGTVLIVYGKQGRTKRGFCPKRKGARSYMAMLCFESDREFWYGSLMSGNISQTRVAPHIIKKCLDKLPYPIYRIRIRGDAIFYSHSFIEEYLERENILYTIEANTEGSEMQSKMQKAEYSSYKEDWEIGEFSYQPTRWKKPHRFIVQRRPIPEDPDERAQLKLFEMKDYGYRVVVTNLMKVKPRHVWNFHSKRAQGAEQNIKELKMNYPLAKIPTKYYIANIAYFQILLFAFNIINWFKWICLPEEYHYKTLQTLRERLIVIPAELTRPGNKNKLEFPAGYPYINLFNQAMKNINKMKQI
ncbi:MAG: IS1380 family transposase [Candidatus Hydrogenedentota bacterium]